MTDVCELIPMVPGLVEQFRPRMKDLLIGGNAYGEQELASLRNLVAAVFRIEHQASPQAIGGLLGLLADWLADRPAGPAPDVRTLDPGDVDAQSGLPYRLASDG